MTSVADPKRKKLERGDASSSRRDAGSSRLEAVHQALRAATHQSARPILDTARQRAELALTGAGSTDEADALASGVYAADVLAELAANGVLDDGDVGLAVLALSEVRGAPPDTTSYDLYARVVSSSALIELPPVTALEIQLRLLLQLGVVSEASLWLRGESVIEPLIVLGTDAPSRRVRATARAALNMRTLSFVGGLTLRSRPVQRFGVPHAAIVARSRRGEDPGRVDAYLALAAAHATPLIERELLLERNAARERMLVGAGEQKLMRLGFDLHDGPIQDVLALGSEVTLLRDQLSPLISDEQRERAVGRFGDLLARLTELDRTLRETAHSLESRSVVSRPLAEILHRDVDAFAERTGIDARLEVKGDPESLTSAQRIAVFRAIQESLANIREHSGATIVEIRLRARRQSIDVRITDDGRGFEVGRSVARAAQHGRLGIVGIAERVRVLGGTFELDSRPGGPTTLSLSLPRITPL